MRVRMWVVVGLMFGGPEILSAKGEGVGVHLHGLIAGVRTKGEALRFEVTGSLELVQYRGQERSAIQVEGKKPMPVIARQSTFCFVMIDDWSWNPGPCKPGQIRKLLERAAQERRPIRLELADATIHFGNEATDIAGAEVIRVFDDKPGADTQ